MADAVTSRVIYESKELYVAKFTGISDATGESAVIKVDKSTLLALDEAEPASLDILRVEIAVATYTTFRILWDHTVADLAVIVPVLSSFPTAFDFQRDYRIPGLPDGGRGLKDPRTAGGAGDILFTTSATAGGVYDVTLWLRKSPD